MKLFSLILLFGLLIITISARTLYSTNSAHNALRSEIVERNKQMIENFKIKSGTANKKFQTAKNDIVRRTIPAQLDAERKAIISKFIHKVEENRDYAANNLTTYTSSDFVWCLDFNGCWPRHNGEAEDYGVVLFYKVALEVNGSVIELQYSIVKMTVLSVDLYQEGTDVDIYKLSYYLDALQLNPVTFQYNEQKTIFWEGFYTFKKNSILIESESVFNVEQGGIDFYSSVVGNPDSNLLCTLIIGIQGIFPGVCPLGSNYQQYQSFQDCYNKMEAVNAYQASIKQCPDRQSSNTTACRQGHAVTAGGNPPQSQITHCPHVAVPSTVCIDRCRPACDNCHANADCALDITLNGTRIYSCRCAPGYYGNGNSCTKKTCTANYQCGDGEYINYATCDTQHSICKCKDSFTWNPLTSRCECQGGAGIRWIGGQAVCLPKGRCEERYHCSTSAVNTNGQSTPIIGDYNDLQCIDRGSSQFLPHKTCICNYGYQGGFFVPCYCPSTSRKEWSSTISGNVCLTTNECTDNWQCASGKVCNKTNGPSLGVGTCQ